MNIRFKYFNRLTGRFLPWYDITPTPADLSSLRADILASILANTPHTKDLKLRMDVIQTMTDEIMQCIRRHYD